MCTGLELLAVGAAATTAAVSVDQAQDAKKDRKQAKTMAENAVLERKAAETKATQDAYASTQMRKQALRQNSLFTGGSGGTAPATQQTLGV
jgi:23S rRNA pseudoU1915 N3-methylase RlmH